MKQQNRAVQFSVALTCICAFWRPLLADEQPPTQMTWNQIVAHRTLREQHFRRFRIEWTSEIFYPKGVLPGKDLNTHVNDVPIQKDDVILTVDSQLIVDFPKVRWEQQGDDWKNLLERVEPSVKVDVVDGDRRFTLNQIVGKASTDTHNGWITAKPVSGTLGKPELAPLLMLYQPVNPACFQFCLGHWKDVTGPKPVIGPSGELLWSYSLHNVDSRPKGRLEVWIDPKQDYVVRRFDYMDGFYVAESTYQLVSNRWVPHKWSGKQNIAPGGPLMCEATNTVNFVDFPEEIDPTIFTVEFPPGTIVVDSSRTESTAKHEKKPEKDDKFFVRKDGTLRPVTPEESLRLATYNEIATTDAGGAGLNRREGWPRSYQFLSVLAIAVACTCWYVVGRRRMQNK